MYKIIATAILLPFAFYLSGQGDVAPSSRPNIVLILVDDAALQDFGAYGGEAHTPNIDRLSQEGIMFTNYHSTLMCAPARAMLLTGCDSHLAGVPNLPVFLPAEYVDRPNYEGVLNTRVQTVATRLKANGYNTYITGKWHLGNTSTTLPNKRGFDRSFILGASGGDNYDIKGYLPFMGKAKWFEDGQPLSKLPDDFYSSEYLVDKMISFQEEAAQKNKPFFSYLAFQAVHIPVQAPPEFVKKYRGLYNGGWSKMKQERYKKAVELGIIPKDAAVNDMLPELLQWNETDEAHKNMAADNMAVNAAMLEAMDYHIGRYITYLKSKDLYDNTVFIITSDNGPEGSVIDNLPANLWMRSVGYHRDSNRLGGPGYYGYIGPEFASAAAGPLSYFKFYAGEGGLRVPLIISGQDIPQGQKRSAFTFVTDVTPTILDITGIEDNGVSIPMTGKSLLPVILSDTAVAHTDEEPIGVEAAGHSALFKGKIKLIRNVRPLGDGIWRLYDLSSDPGETNDISQSHPVLFAEMIRHYADYTDQMGVIEMGSLYVAQDELQNKMIAIVLKAGTPWLFGFIILLIAYLTRKKWLKGIPARKSK